MSQYSKRLVFTNLALTLIAAILVEAAATGEGPQRRRSSKSRSHEPVEELFRNNCARCHGADGRGDTELGKTYKAPDFTDPKWWQEHSGITSPRNLATIVARGKGGMPAFGKKLRRSEINLLINYVRRFRNPSGTAGFQ